jgi:prolyl-tRNA synthetase
MDGLAARVRELLNEIQASLLARARAYRDDHTSRTASYDEFKAIMEGRPGFVIAPWCESEQCEAAIKSETQATVRNIPFGQETPSEPCIKCGQPGAVYAWFAKAY